MVSTAEEKLLASDLDESFSHLQAAFLIFGRKVSPAEQFTDFTWMLMLGTVAVFARGLLLQRWK